MKVENIVSKNDFSRFGQLLRELSAALLNLIKTISWRMKTISNATFARMLTDMRAP